MPRKPDVKRRGVASFGDVLQALVRLSPADDDADAMVRQMLGVAVDRAKPLERSVGPWAATLSTQSGRSAPPPLATSQSGRARSQNLPRAILTRRASSLSVVGTVSFSPPAWLESAASALAVGERQAESPRPTPLFPILRARAVLGSALASWVPEGDLDVEAVVELLAVARPIVAIPRSPLRTLRRGVQVLIDLAPGMDPFRQDIDQLLEDIDQLCRGGNLERQTFAYCPGRGVGEGGRETWRAWQPLRTSAPVLVVSDLGLSGPPGDSRLATQDEWLRFADGVRAQGCPLIALVPFEARRWPPSLARAMALVHWSERTTARGVGRAMREAYRVRR